jgi:hypothetical protein
MTWKILLEVERGAFNAIIFGHSSEDILRTLCEHIRISAGTGFRTEYALIFAGEHLNIIY